MSFPRSVWIPIYGAGKTPTVYRGSPSEIVMDLVKDFGFDDATLEEAIEFIVADIECSLNAVLEIPDDAPLEVQAEYALNILMASGLLRPTPLA